LKSILMTLFAVGAVAALAACGSSSDQASGSGGGSATRAGGTVTVGIPVEDASYAPLYLASERNLWDRYGIKVRLVTFQAGSDLAKAVAGGSVDVAVSALSEMLPAVEQHEPLKAFYGGYNGTPFEWYGQRGVTDIASTKGKNWGVTKVGSSTDFITRYLLSQRGLDPDADVHIIGVGGGDGQIAAMRANQVDVTVASPVTTYQLQEEGYPLVAKQSDLSREYPNHVAYANESFLTDHRANALAFLKGMVDGMNMAKSDPRAAAAAIAERQKVSPDLAMKAYRDNVDYWFPDGRLPSRADMDVFWRIGIENGAWPRAMPESQWLDPQFIDSYASWSRGGQ
jgi:NitT/TauT family transport system substrate-binding protein